MAVASSSSYSPSPFSLLFQSRLYDSVDGIVSGAFKWVLKTSLSVELRGTPATRGLPTIDSPTPAVLVILLYLLVVRVGVRYIKAFDLKPRFREPFLLRTLVLLHNAFCLLLSVYMVLGITYQAYSMRYMIWGNYFNDQETTMAHFIYVFYMSKFVELMDTIIMLLKHNVRQVTVLHVYHHVSIILIWWIIAHDSPGGDAYFSALINSAVHVVMYFYYLLSSILRSDEKKRRKYLFWGKYLTQIQMLQFSINMLQGRYCIYAKLPCPQYLCKILFYYMISLLVLFSNFYVQKYSASTFIKTSNDKQHKG